MAFYPTWQTDPSQGWQNQFIQQIPQNTSAITSLNSLDFQTQSYAYPSNGYVQTGLGFDPNYGRSPYAPPVQRYDFQSQQLSSAPINQVGLQSVGFAPTAVTYAGQVSTAPAPPTVGLQQQQHLGVGVGVGVGVGMSVSNELNKNISGNDTPGYPRVSSVPPRSLNCNGYSGDYSGTKPQQNTTTPTPIATNNNNNNSNSSNSISNSNNSSNNNSSTIAVDTTPMPPPSTVQNVSPSPTRSLMPLQQQQQQSRHVTHSPNQQTVAVPQAPNGDLQPTQQGYGNSVPLSPQQQHEWHWNNSQAPPLSGASNTDVGAYQQQTGERLQLNTRIKSMILRKNDQKDNAQESLIMQQNTGAAPTVPLPVTPAQQSQPQPHPQTQQQQPQQHTGHFLLYSHHLRSDSALTANGPSGAASSITATSPTDTSEQQLQQQTTEVDSIGAGGDIWKPHHINSVKKNVNTTFPEAQQPPTQPQSQPSPQQQQPPPPPPPQQQHVTISHGNTTEMKKPSRKSKARNLPVEQMEVDKSEPPPQAHLSVLKNFEKAPFTPMHYAAQHADYHAQLIKTEPGLLPPPHPPPQHNKMEGYERNYQNFIQYADFCQSEVQGQPPGHHNHNHQQHQHQSQQDYAAAVAAASTYHHNSAAYYASSGNFQQNYQQNFVPGYQHGSAYSSMHGHHATGKTTNGPLAKAVAAAAAAAAASLHPNSNHHIERIPETSSIIPLPTNYEKDIPAHAYPIPPHRYPPHFGHAVLEPKVEEVNGSGNSTYGGYLGDVEGAAASNSISAPVADSKGNNGFDCCRQGGTRPPTAEHLKEGLCLGLQPKQEILSDATESELTSDVALGSDGVSLAPPGVTVSGNNNVSVGSKPKKKGTKQEELQDSGVKHEKINPLFDTSDRLEKGNKTEIPECDCFQSDKNPPEPGTYYTHLGTAATLVELRKEFEERCQISGRQLRIEKIIYTGKEGKTTQGCPVAKWVIRRADPEEKILVVVKKRAGHRCTAAFIIVCMVAWDGMPRVEADNAYKNLIPKLNKFGLPTTRRCATNENRTCACQGLDPETSGASYSFGCSWSMYYNGCKYARSKTVRKFRLSVKSEESAIEDHMNLLATVLAPLFKQVCPRSYENQTKYEKEAPDCRLGLEPGKPFSGVTACLDFCAHAHRDLHNMQDGCTVQVALLKPSNRDGRPPDDEQFHVLPLYTMDTTDEFESLEGQREKNRTGAVQILDK